MITRREAAIISAYTGIMIGSFSEMHKYIEEIMNRPIFTHELADKNLCEEIKQKAKLDFINLNVEGELINE